MSTILDSNPQNTEVSPMKTAPRFALIHAGAGIVIMLALYFMGNPVSMIGGLLSIVVSIAIVVLAVKHHRNIEQGGYISFKQAFLVGFITLIISTLINLIWTYIFISFIAPDYYDLIMEKTIELMQNFGTPQSALDAAMEGMREKMTIGNTIKDTLLYGVIGAAIFAAIIGAIMKKDQPVAF